VRVYLRRNGGSGFCFGLCNINIPTRQHKPYRQYATGYNKPGLIAMDSIQQAMTWCSYGLATNTTVVQHVAHTSIQQAVFIRNGATRLPLRVVDITFYNSVVWLLYSFLIP